VTPTVPVKYVQSPCSCWSTVAGRNDLNNEIEDSIARNTNFYTLSYVPSDPIQDGKYRKINIRTKDPNLIVQAKHGYYPTPPTRPL
jgi:hypothetical protein